MMGCRKGKGACFFFLFFIVGDYGNVAFTY